MVKNNVFTAIRHGCYDLKYHLVVLIKLQNKVMDDEVKDRLSELSYMIFEERWKCTILSFDVKDNSVHILFEASPQVQLSKLINNYKTITSRLLRKEFCDRLNESGDVSSFWEQSYLILTDSRYAKRMIAYYMEMQQKAGKC